MTYSPIHHRTSEDGVITCSHNPEVTDSHANVAGVFSSMPGLDDGDGMPRIGRTRMCA
jgi:hypothetical protein